MEVSAAWLLTIFLAIATVTESVPTVPSTNKIVSSSLLTTEFSDINERDGATTVEPAKTTSKNKLADYARPFTNVKDMKDILMQEIRTLDTESSDEKVSVY